MGFLPAMTHGSGIRLVVRALLAMVLGLAVLFAVNLAGSVLASAAGFPRGGTPRLAWDLLWVVLAGIGGGWSVVRLAPCAPRRHALVFFAGVLLMDSYAVAAFGADFPGGFSAGLLLTVPLQAWPGMRLALPRTRRNAA